uniref:Dynein heavy chain linker domain-containing protein n=1 Tax=Heliothis virescens TaxID=7102 RepID=A0A2A4JD05_HELVI
MSDKGPYYTTDPAQFEVVIQRLFREMLYRCHFIPQVHPMIMTGLVFDKELFLTSIGLMEPNVVDYRERLLKAYRKAIIPLKAYMRQYECYREIYVLDIEEYVENYRNEKHSASETKEEVQIHYDAKQDLIWRLPQFINIGPFAINVDSLKQLLVNKRSDIIKALLVMWAEEVRLVVDDVITAYKGIMRKLGEKPNTIEHVFEIREWMESIPFALKTQDDIMRKVHSDYEVLEAFFMPLENDDFKALWEAIGWPQQITKQVDDTILFLEEEQEKFWKLHMQDEQTLYDKIDMFTAQCMTLTLQNDFSKVHEIANDIKKAWKAMKDAQDWGRILNQRQKLFGQPVVAFADLNKLVKEFEPYRNLWVTASDFLKAREVWLDNPLMYVDADTIEPLVNEYYKTIIKCVRTFQDMPKVQQVAVTIRDLIWRLPQFINIGPFAINVDSLKQLLVNKRSDIIKALLVMWAEEVRLVVDDVITAYKGIMRKLGEKPNTIEHVFEIREWMESIPFALKTQDDIMRKVHSDYEVLEAFFMPLENDDFKALWEAIGWPQQITKQVDDTILFLEEEQEKFWKLHMQDEQTLYDKIDMFTAQCMTLTLQNDFSKVHEIANDIKKAWKAMKDAQDWGRILNQRQKLFGQPVVAFADLNKLVKEFEPYRNLWVTASDFLKAREVWLDNPLMYVDADTIEPLVNEYYKTIIKCVRTFQDMPKVQQVAVTIRDNIDEFRPLIPIIQAVRNPGMKERHWNEFMEKAGITVTMNEKQTFQMCMKQGVAAHGQLIADIGELASKEYVIEQSLDKMQADWANKALEMNPYKNTGTFIMKIADETLQLLDEHLLATQQLGFSPFKAAFELRIQEWDDKLRLTQKVVDEWIECQKEWMYLEPIFTSEDIARQLPMETKKYGTMERIWRRIMSSAAACPKIMIICPDSRLLDSLSEAIHLLAVVSRGLNEYMELKRLRFPRFFFLSDDELLEILSQSRNPRAVQPHLRKCFENIAKVTFQPDLMITHMHSSEGEIVELKYKFLPTSNVEQWLLLLEDTMRHSMDLSAQVSMLGNLPPAAGQAPQIVVEVHARDVTRTLVDENVRNLADFQWISGQAPQIVVEVHARDVTRTLVDENVRNLADFQWISGQAPQIVVEVHARDVTRTLVDENVRNLADFQWISGQAPQIVVEVHARDVTRTLVDENVRNLADFQWISGQAPQIVVEVHARDVTRTLVDENVRNLADFQWISGQAPQIVVEVHARDVTRTLVDENVRNLADFQWISGQAPQIVVEVHARDVTRTLVDENVRNLADFQWISGQAPQIVVEVHARDVTRTLVDENVRNLADFQWISGQAPQIVVEVHARDVTRTLVDENVRNLADFQWISGQAPQIVVEVHARDVTRTLVDENVRNLADFQWISGQAPQIVVEVHARDVTRTLVDENVRNLADFQWISGQAPQIVVEVHARDVTRTLVDENVRNLADFQWISGQAPQIVVEVHARDVTRTLVDENVRNLADFQWISGQAPQIVVEVHARDVTRTLVDENVRNLADFQWISGQAPQIVVEVHARDVTRTLVDENVRNLADFQWISGQAPQIVVEVHARDVTRTLVDENVRNLADFQWISGQAPQIVVEVHARDVTRTLVDENVRNLADFQWISGQAPQIVVEVHARDVTRTLVDENVRNLADFQWISGQAPQIVVEVHARDVTRTLVDENVRNLADFQWISGQAPQIVVEVHARDVTRTLVDENVRNLADFQWISGQAPQIVVEVHARDVTRTLVDENVRNLADFQWISGQAPQIVVEVHARDVTRTLVDENVRNLADFQWISGQAPQIVVEVHARDVTRTLVDENVRNLADFQWISGQAPQIVVEVHARDVTRTLVDENVRNLADFQWISGQAPQIVVEVHARDVTRTLVDENVRNLADFQWISGQAPQIVVEVHARDVTRTLVDENVRNLADFQWISGQAPQIVVEVHARDVTRTLVDENVRNLADFQWISGQAPQIVVEVHARDVTRTLVDENVRNLADFQWISGQAPQIVVEVHARDVTRTLVDENVRNLADFQWISGQAPQIVVEVHARDVTRTLVDENVRNLADFQWISGQAPQIVVEVHARDVTRTLVDENVRNLADFQWISGQAPQIVVEVHARDVTRTLVDENVRNLADFQWISGQAPQIVVEVHARDVTRTLVDENVRNLADFQWISGQAPQIVVEVHARDVTRTLVDENVRNLADFQWICQLRYYQIVKPMWPLEADEEPDIFQDEVHLDTSRYYRQFSQNTCDVRALNSIFTYQNEYLGNSGRLVITPLTDRCYLTLMCAMHLKFGGAPAGPAGTGKTETTKDGAPSDVYVAVWVVVPLHHSPPETGGRWPKSLFLVQAILSPICCRAVLGESELAAAAVLRIPDLAKALAVQCVVFNCSDQLDFMAMGKFFKGLAASGAWACFDEFNRIDIEVLSVVAQQVVTIQKAQIARLDRFMFEGVDLPLKASCSVFITMNPGYAGRTELPDNLKALFRPIAMMVPDYALIAEISLFSFGFSEAKILAGKITTTFRLSSEQLSTQDHYDFGMRAVKTVITVAGNLIRQMPDGDERQIVLRALKDVNVPKFLANDLVLFNGIISDLFPRVEVPVVDYGIMEQSIRTMLAKKGYDDLYSFIFKVIQLYETTVVRHGLMLVGPAGAGKTKCYETLRDALTAIKGKMAPDGFPFTPVHTFVVNPKSITMGQLYGEFDLLTHEWTDGILSSLVRAGIAVEDMDRRWYVFDGPVDAVWIENMNTVLDDNKKLCLSSGEIMKLTERQRMIFEVADLTVASPATVSRCGMVYLDAQVVGLPPLINAWIKSNLPPIADPIRKALVPLITTYLYPAIDLLRSKLTEIVGSIDSALVLKFLELLDYRLRPLTGKDDRPPPPANFLALMPRLAPLWVVWAVIWSVGATCDHNGRAIFSDFIRETTAEAGLKPQFPAEGRVYDYTLHDGGFTDPTEDGEPAAPYWYSWMANLGKYVVDPDWQYADIEVPTMDNVRSAAILGYKILNYNHVICVGPTGTGKTVTITAKLSRGLHRKFICEFLVFSARTSANQTQDVIDSKLERRRRGVFGPPPTKRQVFFIDDLNMPALEVFGAQPPIELLRQFMDFGDDLNMPALEVFGAQPPIELLRQFMDFGGNVVKQN